jgi:hypothetical protein
MVAVSVPQVRRGWTAGGTTVEGAALTFIQVARGMRYDGSTLALVDLAPTTPYVSSGRPVLGHVTTGAFLDIWVRDLLLWSDDRSRSCVLSLADPTIAPMSDVLLRLCDPRIHGTGLRYSVSAIAGTLPESSGACVLYVNAGSIARASG